MGDDIMKFYIPALHMNKMRLSNTKQRNCKDFSTKVQTSKQKPSLIRKHKIQETFSPSIRGLTLCVRFEVIDTQKEPYMLAELF